MRLSESSYEFPNQPTAYRAVQESLQIFCRETGWRFYNPISFDRMRNSRSEIVFATFSICTPPNTYLVEVYACGAKVTISWKSVPTSDDTFYDSVALNDRIFQLERLIEQHLPK
ncbi:MAG TPA: hypothetical protein VD907_01840 [Verrucomicrobiae bacterium]|nr:hypothetical protein [Verrucomicrobiae bacterium]